MQLHCLCNMIRSATITKKLHVIMHLDKKMLFMSDRKDERERERERERESNTINIMTNMLQSI